MSIIRSIKRYASAAGAQRAAYRAQAAVPGSAVRIDLFVRGYAVTLTFADPADPLEIPNKLNDAMPGFQWVSVPFGGV